MILAVDLPLKMIRLKTTKEVKDYRTRNFNKLFEFKFLPNIGCCHQLLFQAIIIPYQETRVNIKMIYQFQNIDIFADILLN